MKHCGTVERRTERLLRPFREGVALSHDHWGKGFVTEAVKAVIAFLFDTVGYRKIIAGCDARNIGSQKVMEKVGMRREACLRQQILRKDGTFGDDLQYGLFREEFQP